MTLAAGSRLGTYEVVAPLGVGGMGEVYRARDTRLGRDVALKILPEAVAADPDRLARFEREAQVLAALNHPHIGAIYGLEDASGARALVLELVEGPTLADRIAQGALPVDEALPIARQIAEALEAAHEQGIVHRDLKPANIKVRSDGTVKVLDFGLAKLANPVAGETGTPGQAGRFALSQSPTITTPAMMTGVGMILGTAAYMSPEQAKGQAADKRSDVWAFGCVLFEMLTGTRAFHGDDISETLASVLKDVPDWSALPSTTPTAVRTLLARSLQKDPKRRLPAIAVARLDIDDALAAPRERAPEISRKPHPRRERLAWGIATLAMAVAATLALAGYLKRPPVDDRVTRFSVPLPEGWTLATAPVQFRISPDGRRIVMVATNSGRPPVLWLHSLDALAPQELPGTEDATAPFWSPDSRHVAFRARGKLKKIDVNGGQPIALCDSPDTRGGTWNREGIILFVSGGRLRRVSESGGVPAVVETVPAEAGQPSVPHFLPDGRHFLYRTFAGVFVGSLDSPDRKQIFSESDAGYVEYTSGRLVFERDGTLMAQPFDVSRMELSGEPRPIADAIQVFSFPRNGLFSTSTNGTLAYQARAFNPGSQLTWLDRSGTQLATLGAPADYADVSLSPDGKRAAVTILDPAQRTRNVWVVDEAGSLRQLTFDPDEEIAPVWSHDGSRIAFAAKRGGRWGVYQKLSSGAAGEEKLLEAPPESISDNPLGWTADDRTLLVISGTVGTGNLSTLPLSGDRKLVSYLTGREAGPGQFSPDDRWIALSSGETGRQEIYVRSYPNRGGKWRVSTDGGAQPRWRQDGKELYYYNDSRVFAAEVSTQGDAFQLGAVRPLFTLRAGQTRYAYDVTPDGQRFLVNARIVSQSPSPPLTVVVNWPATLNP